MSVNLERNRNAIVAAWKDVLNDKSNTNWALYGYEPQTNDLKVISTGDGGLEELNEELNPSNIMYAFVRVQDPKTSLTKYVLINWQGESALTVRKGTCANHIRDISNVLTGAHLTINARNEDEMEPDLIMQKVSSVGSAYSFKEPRMQQEEQRKPVGTNYSRVVPAKEINSVDRDLFWRKEEEEERRRVETEKERKQVELLKSAKESKLRDEREHTERERRLANQVTNVKSTVSSTTIPGKISPQPLSPSQLSPVRTQTQAEEMRQKRNLEARELIGSRVGVAKAIFTQNSSSGQMINKTSSTSPAAPIKPVRNSIAQRINTLNSQSEIELSEQRGGGAGGGVSNVGSRVAPLVKKTIISEGVVIESETEKEDGALSEKEQIKRSTEVSLEYMPLNGNNNGGISAADDNIVDKSQENQQQQPQEPEEQEQQYAADESDQFSTIKRSPYSKTNSANSQVSTPVDTEPPQQIPSPTANATAIMDVNNDLVTEDDIIYQDIMKDGGLKAKALYDYQAADESEITFDPGDMITHIDQIDEGWWQGLGPDGTYGLFPANYVQLV